MIRRYTLEDIPYIVELERKNLGTTLGCEMLEADLNNELSYSYVYEEEDKIIGYISLVFDGYAVEILNFCMDNAFQNQGKGTLFLAEILDMFYSKKATNAILEVRRSNERAIHVYKKLGFQPIRTRRNYYSDGEDAIVLQKLFVSIDDIEDAYLQCYAKYEYHDTYIRVYDLIQKDKYYHNFYKITAEEGTQEIIKALYSQSLEEDYVQFFMFKPESILKDFELENNIYLHSNIYKIKSLKDKKYNIEKLTEERRNEFIQFLYEEDKQYGEAYSKNNANRLALMALDEKKIEYFIILNENQEIIGSIHCFIFKDFAKIEEFVILNQYRHKEYGNALFMHVIEYLKQKGIHDVVLCADNLDTVKHMYYRMGFTLCGEYYLYRKVFNDGKNKCDTDIRK